MVEAGGDSSQGRTLVAQPLDFRQRTLLGRFHMLPVDREPEAGRDVPYALPQAALVVKCISGALPIASRSHWETAAMMFSTSRPAAEPVPRNGS